MKKHMKTRIIYRLLVLTLRAAKRLAIWHGCARAILADAEGDSGYGEVRRGPVEYPLTNLGDTAPWDYDNRDGRHYTIRDDFERSNSPT